MSPLRLNGSTSGNVTLDAPAVAGSNTIVLPTGNGTANQILRNGATAGNLEFTDKIVSGTAVASTSGTSIDFTGIPSWVKRVTVMFDGVSLNGSSFVQIQIGTSGGVQTTGYACASTTLQNASVASVQSFTSGFVLRAFGAPVTQFGVITLSLLNATGIWTSCGSLYSTNSDAFIGVTGNKNLSGTLDRVRITTVNGTDTFDAGSINLLWE